MRVAALVVGIAFSAVSQEMLSTNSAVMSTNAPNASTQNVARARSETGARASTRGAVLQAMSGQPTNPVALPKVLAGCSISAAEVLRKGLEARGGATAAAGVLSFRAKGKIDLDNSLLGVSPVEYVAKRPNQFRMLIDLKTAAGGDIGRFDQGFDGTNGWDLEPGGPVRVREGKILQERREGAEFFAWYAEPGNYVAAEVLGEARFAGRKCYAVKLVRKSGSEVMLYYDTATFLLAGLMETAETEAGPTLRKLSFADYRALGGFQMPTVLALQTQATNEAPRCIAIEFSSLEVNAVKEPVKMPADRRGNIAAASKQPVYAEYEQDFRALLPKPNGSAKKSSKLSRGRSSSPFPGNSRLKEHPTNSAWRLDISASRPAPDCHC